MIFIEKFINSLQGKTTKIYLIFANIILVIFAIWFFNVGLLPFSNTSDFLFFVLLGLIFAIYRPGWAFVFFIGSIALENINLAPQSLGLAIRPYQLLGALIIVALIIRAAMKKLPLPANEFFPKFKWYDALLIIFILGGFLSSIGAANKAISLKQSVVALSFVALYFLVRTYIQSLDDLKRIAPFFLSSAVVVVLYGILQNIIFIHGENSFEVMLGRPNATFTEPDWLGIYLVFLLTVIFTVIYQQSKKIRIFNFQFSIFNKFSITNDQIKKYIIHATLYILLGLVFIGLILTVSRSAWLGAILITLGFLKIILTNGSLKISEWNWNNFLRELRNLVLAIIFSFIFIYAFHLTNFQIGNRAASTGGLQKITIACVPGGMAVPEQVANVNELAQYNCKFINLEDIGKEKAAGNNISEIYRTDPNVNTRANIYQKSIAEIKHQPILGIGWGNISAILGTDERGTGLNASNIFLEVWLGAGLVGILSFVILLGYVFTRSAMMYLDRKIEDKTVATFILLGWIAIVIPNLFNSGIFLGFLWVYLAIAISLIEARE